MSPGEIILKRVGGNVAKKTVEWGFRIDDSGDIIFSVGRPTRQYSDFWTRITEKDVFNLKKAVEEFENEKTSVS